MTGPIRPTMDRESGLKKQGHPLLSNLRQVDCRCVVAPPWRQIAERVTMSDSHGDDPSCGRENGVERRLFLNHGSDCISLSIHHATKHRM